LGLCEEDAAAFAGSAFPFPFPPSIVGCGVWPFVIVIEGKAGEMPVTEPDGEAVEPRDLLDDSGADMVSGA
jgi:hypothetical protein